MRYRYKFYIPSQSLLNLDLERKLRMQIFISSFFFFFCEKHSISFNTVQTRVFFSIIIFLVQFTDPLYFFSQATETIQAIVLNSPRLEEDFRSFEDFVKPFSKMCNLRLLIIDFADIPNGINYLSNDLRFLEWFDYRSKKCLPPSFRPQELGELILPFSHIKYLWDGVKVILFF